MEAWLEELPTPRNPLQVPRQLGSLQEAAVSRNAAQRPELSLLKAGNERATLWFFSLEFLQNLWPLFLFPDGRGVKTWKHALLERHCSIESTHVPVAAIHFPGGRRRERREWLKAVFAAMQSSSWTPDGEARTWLRKRRLSHASMSVGDAIQVGPNLYVATISGFVRIDKGHLMLPCDEQPSLGDEFSEGEEDVDSELCAGAEDEEETESELPDVRSAPRHFSNQQGTSAKGKGKKGGGKGRGGGGGKGESTSKGGSNGGRKADKGRGKGKGKQGADGEGQPQQPQQQQQEAGEGGKGGGRRRRNNRAKEPGPQGHTQGPQGPSRADRRRLRAQLQATREQLQG